MTMTVRAEAALHSPPVVGPSGSGKSPSMHILAETA